MKKAGSWQALAASGMMLSVSLVGLLRGSSGLEQAAYGAIVVSGAALVWAALRGLWVERRITSALLITIAMVACIIIGEVFAAGEVAFIMALGEKLEDCTVERARRGIHALARLMPNRALLVRGEQVEEIGVDEVRTGDVLRVRPGELIPADAEVVAGFSTVDESTMTGESMPVDKNEGDTVYAGTMNGYGSMDICATRFGADSTLKQLIHLVQEADKRKAPLQRVVDKWASWLVPIALALAILAYVYTGDLERAVTVLVVFCPCALALATPTSVVAAIGQATRYGVLIKSGEALERIARVRCFAFDKTGTLTQGVLTVSDVYAVAEGISADSVLEWAAAVESRSEHPIGRAIVANAKKRGLSISDVEQFNIIPGVGAEGIVEGIRVFCGKTTGTLLPSHVNETLSALRSAGKVVVVVCRDENIVGVVALTDTPRAEASKMVQSMLQSGMQVAMLTGDHLQAATHLGHRIGIADVHAGLLPADKSRIISEIEAAGNPVCMVGDGVNDAPALRQAYAGIAMGGMGSDIARDAADITLLSSDLANVPYVQRLAQSTLRTIKFNITLSMLINVVAIALSVAGLMGPVVGALVHNAGSVLVVLNAALLYERKIRQ